MNKREKNDNIFMELFGEWGRNVMVNGNLPETGVPGWEINWSEVQFVYGMQMRSLERVGADEDFGWS